MKIETLEKITTKNEMKKQKNKFRNYEISQFEPLGRGVEKNGLEWKCMHVGKIDQLYTTKY
jgi:hypothetical protein